MVVPNSNNGHCIKDFLSSPFFVRKAKSYFKAMNVAGDGFLTLENYEKLASRAIENQETREEDDEVRNVCRNIFTNVVAAHIRNDLPAKVTFDQLFA